MPFQGGELRSLVIAAFAFPLATRFLKTRVASERG